MLEAYKAHIAAELALSPGVAVLFDGWSQHMTKLAGVGHSYIGVSVSYFTSEPDGSMWTRYTAKHVPLATRWLEHPHTAERIAELLTQVAAEYGFDFAARGRVTATVTDNANTERAAGDLLVKPHQNCLCHTIHLAVTDALESPEVGRAFCCFSSTHCLCSQVKGLRDVIDTAVHTVRSHAALRESFARAAQADPAGVRSLPRACLPSRRAVIRRAASRP